jgi:hypothetical protein
MHNRVENLCTDKILLWSISKIVALRTTTEKNTHYLLFIFTCLHISLIPAKVRWMDCSNWWINLYTISFWRLYSTICRYNSAIMFSTIHTQGGGLPFHSVPEPFSDLYSSASGQMSTADIDFGCFDRLHQFRRPQCEPVCFRPIAFAPSGDGRQMDKFTLASDGLDFT